MEIICAPHFASMIVCYSFQLIFEYVSYELPFEHFFFWIQMIGSYSINA